MQVDVFTLPNYELNRAQQEWLWIFSLIVAGKSAEYATKKLNAYLAWGWEGDPMPGHWTPFDVVATDIEGNALEEALMAVKTGQYKKLLKALPYSVDNLPVHEGHITVEDLEACPGCGPKTARFFYMMTRPNARCAALDTHVLKFLRDCGYEGVPTLTPSKGPTYRRLEEAFLAECDKRGREPAEFDVEVWKSYREGKLLAGF